MTTEKKTTLILAGGGHSHALLLKRNQASPLLNCRLVLVSQSRYTPYSGMLPGVISGHYSAEEAHIDLRQLAAESRCEFIEAEISALDADNNRIQTGTGEWLNYDLLSINTGSTQARVVEAPNCISIKPVNQFLLWLNNQLPNELQKKPGYKLLIVGAGAAGVEVSLALKKRFAASPNLEIHLLTANGVLAGHPEPVRNLVCKELNSKQVYIQKDFRVANVSQGVISSTLGKQLEYDQLVLATPASPASWLSDSGLTTDSKGFIRVNDTLQSSSHENVFASGDIAAFTSPALAKCGVYAVRQAPVLHQNLAHALQHSPLIPYQPQSRFLSLLSCADGRAIASRGWFRAQGNWVWYCKDWIDRRFMAQFPLPEPGSMEY